MRKFLIAFIFMLGIMFLITRFTEMQAILETLGKGDLRFILLAVGLHLIWLVTVSATFRALYKALGLNETIRSLIPLFSAAYFTNVVAPSAGMSGAAFFVSEARRRGYSTARAAVVGALFLEFDYLGLLAVLGLGLVVLIRRNDLNTTDVVASAILVCIAAGVALLLYLGMRSADALGKALGWMARAVNTIVRPFIKREYLSEQRAQGFAHDAAEGLREIRQEPRSMIMPLLLTLVNKTLLVLILLCSFLAFKVPVSIGTIIAGFSIAYLFVIVSPTPAGIGFVEGIMTLTLRSMYVPLEAATVITLTYRGITFWLPLLYGMFMFRWISKEKEKSS